MIEVGAERARLDRAFQIAVGGRKDPHVDFRRVVRAHAGDFAAFEHAEEFDLGGHRHVADFVEKEGAAVGELELADAIGRGVGEGALDVAEQLAFEDVLAERRAVERDERLGLARAVLVDGLGHELLARARLALDEHAGVSGRDAFELIDHVAHLGALADHALEAEFLVQAALQLSVGAMQSRAFGRGQGDRPELFDIERLEQVIEGPLLHCGHGRRDRAVPGHEDHGRFGLLTLGLGEDGQAVDVVHHQVGDHDVERRFFEDGGPLLSGGRHAAMATDPGEGFGDRLRVRHVVVDHEHLDGRGRTIRCLGSGRVRHGDDLTPNGDGGRGAGGERGARG